MLDQQEFIERLLNPATREVAYRQLVDRYKRPLYHHIRGIVIDHDDADDVLQNTFVKIFRHLDNFKGESKLFSWMYRIATNEALSHLRSQARMRGVNHSEYQALMVNNLHADTYFDGGDLETRLQQAVAQLPEKQQLVFRMKYYQDLKYEEISEILGTSVGALKASYHHAVKKIEDHFNRD